MAQPAREKLLLIGYGNTLRGDDGIGSFVVSEFAARHADRVSPRVVQQLTPEMCMLFAEHDTVIFVDASAAGDGQGCCLVPIEIIETTAGGTHVSSPASLLALAFELLGQRPRAWCLAVPGEDFRLGAGFSPVARLGAETAMRMLEEFLRCL